MPASLQAPLPVELDALEESAQEPLEVGGRVLDGVEGILGAVGGALGPRRRAPPAPGTTAPRSGSA